MPRVDAWTHEVNYASYDPQLKQRGISGMAHGGKISFTNDKRVLFSIRLKENVGKEYYSKYFEPIAVSSRVCRSVGIDSVTVRGVVALVRVIFCWCP